MVSISAPLNSVRAVSASQDHSLSLQYDGTVWAWGGNEFGQLGDGTTDNRDTPALVMASESVPFANVEIVAASWFHSLALKGDGTVWAWGDNEYGQLGDGSNTARVFPVQVLQADFTLLDNVVAISCGMYHSIAIRADGSVMAWGMNTYGQLGDGSRSWYPVKALMKLPWPKMHLFMPAVLSGAKRKQ